MSSNETKLFPGEAVLYRTRLHWLVILRHILAALTVGVIVEVIFFFLLIGATFFSIRLPPALDLNQLEWTSYLLTLIPFLVIGAAAGLIDYFTSELIATNQRALIKTGVLRHRTFEVILTDQRAFQIRNTLLSKPLGFKSLDLDEGYSFPFADPAGLVRKKEPPPAPRTAPPEEKLRLGEAPRSQQAVFADIESAVERTQRLIREASGQIKQGHLTEAKAIVRELLKTDPDNANVWYLAGHLAASPKKKRRAFERALNIDPEHRKARQALDLLR